MAMTETLVGRSPDGNPVYRYTETGAANTSLTATATPGSPFRFVSAHVAYSAAPTQTGVLSVLDSGAGATFDARLNTGTANQQYTNHLPTPLLLCGDDDAILVVAPAGGVGVTAAISIYIEKLLSKTFPWPKQGQV